MALMPCRECGKEISSLAHACPHCGAPTHVATPAAPAIAPPVAFVPASSNMYGCLKAFLILGAIAVGLFVLLIIFGAATSSPESDARYQAGEAIKLCWKDYERKSFDPSTKRFIAGACEKMEADFKQKYGREP